MLEFFNNLRKQIAEFLGKLDKKQKNRLIMLVTLLLVVCIGAVVLLNYTSYAVLYSGMQPADAGTALSRLQEMGVKVKTQGSDTILVPEGQVDALRMQLAFDGFPQSGYSYDIFQMGSGLGMTDMEKNVYLQFQLQENIRKALTQMAKVKDAEVNVSLSKGSSFVLSSNSSPASAGIMLTLYSNQELNSEEVRAVGEFVRSSVPNLALENVRVVDTNMNLYSFEDAGSGIELAGTQLALQKEVQKNLESQINKLLQPVFGIDKVFASVNVILDFDKVVTQSVKFEPPVEGEDEGIVISLKELTENVYGGYGGGEPGVDANGGAATYPTLTGDDSWYNRVSREANYEVNETKQQIERAQGTIKDLSVSVLLDSALELEDYSESVRNLVSSAVGVETRYVTVERLPFIDNSAALAVAEAALAKRLSMERWMDLAKTIVTALTVIGIVFLLFLLVRNVLQVQRGAIMQAAGGNFNVLVGEEDLNEETPAIDINSKKSEVTVHIEKYIEKDPSAVAQLLRNWFVDDH